MNSIHIQMSKIYKGDVLLSNYAFSLFDFSIRLYRECKEKDITQIYFLAREGKFLKKIFDNMKEYFGWDIQTHYLFVSRNSVFLAKVDINSPNTFSILANDVQNVDTLKIMSYFGFNENDSDIQTILKQYKTCNKDTFTKIINDERIKSKILNYKNTEIKKLKEYLKSEGYTSEQYQCVVDVGWRGSMQDSLHELFGKPTIGYYIGLTNKHVEKDNVKKGLLFDCNVSFDLSSYSYSYDFYNYEIVLKAGHGKTTGYTIEHLPILVFDLDIDAYEFYISELQEKILKKVNALILLIKDDFNEKTRRMMSYYHRKMLIDYFFKKDSKYETTRKMHKDGFVIYQKNINITKIKLIRIKNFLIFIFKIAILKLKEYLSFD